MLVRGVLIPAQRIESILESASLLDKYDWPELDLILGQHGLPVSDYAPGTKRDYVLAMIKDERDDRLEALHAYLTGEAGGGWPGASPWSGDQLRLFCSHLANHREVVGAVARELERYGVLPFVAHTPSSPVRNGWK